MFEPLQKQKWKASYAHMLGRSPECRPDSREQALAYFYRIRATIEHGGWDKSEGTRLYALKHKWLRRAQGKDIRFRLLGTASGKLPSHMRKQYADLKLIYEIKEMLHGRETQ